MNVEESFSSAPELPPLITARAICLDAVNRVLLLRRKKSQNHNPGLWEGPGGKSDLQKENSIDPAIRLKNLTETVVRETQEETGQLIIPYGQFYRAETRTILDGKYAGRLYTVDVTMAEMPNPYIHLNYIEHDDHTWAPVQYALESIVVTEAMRRALEHFQTEHNI